jgi:hypothetical protein
MATLYTKRTKNVKSIIQDKDHEFTERVIKPKGLTKRRGNNPS